MTAQEIVPNGQVTLEELAERINAGYGAVNEAAIATVERAIALGRDLLSASDQIPQGDWGKWCETNLVFSSHTAQKYMRLAKYEHLITDEIRFPEMGVSNHGRLTYGGGIGAALGYINSRGVPSTVRGRYTKFDHDEARRLRRGGMSYEEIADLFGVTSQSVQFACLPEAERRARKARARRVLKERERLIAQAKKQNDARAHSDAMGESYALLRRTLQQLQHVHDTAETQKIRQHVASAMSRLHGAEDFLGRAIREMDGK